MREEHDHLAPSPRDSPTLRRPPYGMPMRRRAQPTDTADGLRWRRYATPTPPRDVTLTTANRLTRLTLVACFLACVGMGVWSSTWDMDSSPRPRAATEASPIQTAVAHLVEDALPLSGPTPSASPSTRSSPAYKTSQPKKRGRLDAQVAPRQQDKKVQTGSQRQSSYNAGQRHGGNKGAGGRSNRKVDRRGVGKCDELFPPSRSDFRIRNRICHRIYR